MKNNTEKIDKVLQTPEFRMLMSQRLTPLAVKRLASYVPLANKIWAGAMKQLSRNEKETKTPFTFNKEPKLYALDGVAIAGTLGLKDVSTGLTIFSIYYLCAHMYDDIVEDQKKFHSKFVYKNMLEENALGISFFLHALSVVVSITNDFTIIKIFLESLAAQTLCFTQEKDKKFSPREVFELKERKINGILTSFLADCLCLHDVHIKKGLYYLGSLTQFTDDIRDYEEDKQNGNANLLISMENHFGKVRANERYVQWYKKEEKRMEKEFHKSGIDNLEIIKAIPWHPFSLKHLTQGDI